MSDIKLSYRIQRRINDENFQIAFDKKLNELYKNKCNNTIEELQKFIENWDKKYKVQFINNQHVQDYNSQLQDLQDELKLKNRAFKLIIENAPACINDEDCPANGGYGYDQGCAEDRCPALIAKQAREGNLSIAEYSTKILENELQDFSENLPVINF